MNKQLFGLFCLLAIIAMTAASAKDDREDRYYKESPRKVVYVEKEPEQRRPRYELVKKEPEYKKDEYEYREPEEKIVQVVKQEEQKYVLSPVYDPKKDVVVKILDKKY